MEEREIFFRRNDADTWALARLHHSLLLQIQDSPLWEREDIPDIPLTEEQMVSFVRGYNPDFGVKKSSQAKEVCITGACVPSSRKQS